MVLSLENQKTGQACYFSRKTLQPQAHSENIGLVVKLLSSRGLSTGKSRSAKSVVTPQQLSAGGEVVAGELIGQLLALPGTQAADQVLEQASEPDWAGQDKIE